MITHGGDIFSVARARGIDWRDMLDFSASINPLGPAPGVRDAITAALDEIVHYPDPYATRLTRALAQYWNVDHEAILVGNGATDLIHFLARAWPHERTSLVVPTFSEFHRAYPQAELVTSVWPTDGLLIVTNPNNPTGQLSCVPERRGPTLVDESFLEFTDEPATPNATIRLRSLTKFHAIPGLRVGALVGPPDLTRELRAKREPWTVNVIAEAAAIGSMRDLFHAAWTRAFVREEGERLYRALGQINGVHPLMPAANYIFATLDYDAAPLREHMLNRRMLIRDCSETPGVNGSAVRVAVRTRDENNRLIAAWREYKCG